MSSIRASEIGRGSTLRGGRPGAALFSLCLGVAMIACGAPRRARLVDGSQVPGPDRVEIIAHRGAHDRRPENSLPAIERAIALGLDWVEIDVRQSRDGTCFLLHDGDVGATTEGSGEIRDLRDHEVRRLHAGAGWGEPWESALLPTLDEALALMEGRIGGYVDLKDADAEAVVARLVHHGMIDDALIYTADADALHRADPRARALPEYPGAPELLPELVARTKADTIAISRIARLTPEAVAAAHALGVRVFVDLMKDDTPEGVAYVVACGVDGIQTDDPVMVHSVLRRLGKR
ncbi:MAG: glycerophosphodiester phosphodiesterase family protein [Planctomycetota bacterium]